MIIFNLVGGLGNQMFQYACARALAAEVNEPLKTTIDMFGMYPGHKGVELERVFGLRLDVATPAELQRAIGLLRASPRLRWLLGSNFFAPVRGSGFIVDSPNVCPESLRDSARAPVYLQGYWQSERYFLNHEALIRRHFTFRRPPTGRNAELAHTILACTAVSIHVRRGDYVSNSAAASVHGVCAPDYYFRAMENVRRRVPKARFFAFSDDPGWVRKVLLQHSPDIVLVEGNPGESSYNDMQLMSLCRHHIIANSSFSWWGAWLNPDPNKIVIAPRHWYKNGPDTGHLLPPAWERI